MLENRYNYIKIDNYVIMPNHIHILLSVHEHTAGASPRPTVIDIICSYKSLTTKECKKCGKVEKIFQPSFYDHVVRNRTDFDDIYEYIQNNPQNWITDEMYCKI
ncbi:MAG: transposase [Oscillospiraceae bacterium]|nr:transposase [Oscillospiraceae bacterium]